VEANEEEEKACHNLTRDMAVEGVPVYHIQG
jgi:hypothetical protein